MVNGAAGYFEHDGSVQREGDEAEEQTGSKGRDRLKLVHVHHHESVKREPSGVDPAIPTSLLVEIVAEGLGRDFKRVSWSPSCRTHQQREIHFSAAPTYRTRPAPGFDVHTN